MATNSYFSSGQAYFDMEASGERKPYTGNTPPHANYGKHRGRCATSKRYHRQLESYQGTDAGDKGRCLNTPSTLVQTTLVWDSVYQRAINTAKI
jgi:hypothetical protein